LTLLDDLYVKISAFLGYTDRRVDVVSCTLLIIYYCFIEELQILSKKKKKSPLFIARKDGLFLLSTYKVPEKLLFERGFSFKLLFFEGISELDYLESLAEIVGNLSGIDDGVVVIGSQVDTRPLYDISSDRQPAHGSLFLSSFFNSIPKISSFTFILMEVFDMDKMLVGSIS